MDQVMVWDQDLELEQVVGLVMGLGLVTGLVKVLAMVPGLDLEQVQAMEVEGLASAWVKVLDSAKVMVSVVV